MGHKHCEKCNKEISGKEICKIVYINWDTWDVDTRRCREVHIYCHSCYFDIKHPPKQARVEEVCINQYDDDDDDDDDDNYQPTIVSYLDDIYDLIDDVIQQSSALPSHLATELSEVKLFYDGWIEKDCKVRDNQFDSLKSAQHDMLKMLSQLLTETKGMEHEVGYCPYCNAYVDADVHLTTIPNNFFFPRRNNEGMFSLKNFIGRVYNRLNAAADRDKGLSFPEHTVKVLHNAQHELVWVSDGDNTSWCNYCNARNHNDNHCVSDCDNEH